MSFTEILPEIRSPSRGDKLKIIQELERDEAEIIESGRDYPAWSPDSAFAAGETMLKFWQKIKCREQSLSKTARARTATNVRRSLSQR